jgi:hypothetical protein
VTTMESTFSGASAFNADLSMRTSPYRQGRFELEM